MSLSRRESTLSILPALAGAPLTSPALAADGDALFVSQTSDHPHRAMMALAFAKNLADRKGPVTIVLNDRPVLLARKSKSGRSEAHREALRAPMKQGATILVCPMCMQHIVVMDNLGSHKGNATRAAIRAAVARLVFLPPDSPDLNPIEQVFAKMKALLRKVEVRTVDAVWRRIGPHLHTLSPAECTNSFRKAGCGST